MKILIAEDDLVSRRVLEKTLRGWGYEVVATCDGPSAWQALQQTANIDMALLEQFKSHANTPLANFVAQVLATNRDQIRQGYFFAWDPLAAAALANPAVVTFRPLAIEMSGKPEELGRTAEIKNRRANAQVAVDADPLRFRDVFMTALGVQ